MSNDDSGNGKYTHNRYTARASERTLYTRVAGATEYGGKVF